MINNILRVGNITSSEGAVAVMSNGKVKDSFGKPALTYIEECNFERRLGRSIDAESNAKPLTWGKAIEKRVFQLLGIAYKLVSSETVQHPTIKHWVGSPDAEKEEENDEKTVIDIKSPQTLKSFCQLVEGLYKGLTGIEAMEYIRENHKDGEKFYWQLVSNAVLIGAKYAELIVYAPYESELLDLQAKCAPSQDCPKGWNWIYYAEHDELPSLKDGGYYKNINVIRFEVPEGDKKALHHRMVMAGELLITV